MVVCELSEELGAPDVCLFKVGEIVLEDYFYILLVGEEVFMRSVTNTLHSLVVYWDKRPFAVEIIGKYLPPLIRLVEAILRILAYSYTVKLVNPRYN